MDPTKLERNEEKTTDNTPIYHGDLSPSETVNEGSSPPQPTEATSKGPPPPRPHETTSKGPPPPQPIEATIKGPPPPKPHELTSKGPPPPQPIDVTTKGPPPPKPHEATSKGPPPPPQPVDNEPSSQETGNDVSSPTWPMEATSKGPPPPKPYETTSKGPPPPQHVHNGSASQATRHEVSLPVQPMEATSKGPPPPKPHETTSKGSPPQPIQVTTKVPPRPRPHEVTSKGPPPPQATLKTPKVYTLVGEGETWNALKLVVMGHGAVGKTTLLHEMKHINDWQPPWVKKTNLNLSRTTGPEYSQMKIGKGHVLVWDFGGKAEQIVTNQLLLSNEMVVYILCYDLSASTQSQNEQVSYWLSVLQSNLPCNPAAASKWSVVMVGTKSDACDDLSNVKELNPIPTWQTMWPNLPLYQKCFIVSSHSRRSIRKLFQSLEDICNHIFQNHTMSIPKSYKTLLLHLLAYSEMFPIVPLPRLEAEFVRDGDISLFRDALQHLHAIGYVVWIAQSSPPIVCLRPQMIADIAAEFISLPALPHAHKKLSLPTHNIDVIDTQQIGFILNVKIQETEWPQKLDLMELFGVCFKLISKKQSVPSYLFPSLYHKSDDITFTIAKSLDSHFCGAKFIAPQNLIFTNGFFYTLVTDLFRELNMTRQELIRVHANGIVITCAGVFTGQLILKVEQKSRSMVMLILALNPDLSFAERVLETVIQTKFTQYAGFIKRRLCVACIEEFTATSEKMGTIEEGIGLQRCDPYFHPVIKSGLPAPNPLLLVHQCHAHHQTKHSFFLSYCVATEGKKTSFQTKEGASGFVELIYEQLALQKIETQPLFVFWDQKCLQIGQDWEEGFLHGITSCDVIILILSNKVIEAICSAAPTRQVSTLLEYECALLQNTQKGVPVIPLFVAEMIGDDQFDVFDLAKANSILPDVAHSRSENANHIIADLSQSLPAGTIKFLTSIKKTMDKIFRLQGVFLPKRGEDQKAIDDFLTIALKTVQDYKLTQATSKGPPPPRPHPVDNIFIDASTINRDTQVGAGSYGVVFKGMWKSCPVAIKQICCRTDFEINIMQNEVSLANRLEHAHIVKVHGVCKISDLELWLVMELADSNLTTFLADPSKDISWIQRWEWAMQAASSLAFLHSKGIAHGDIKSSNFLLKDNVLKLTDFGISASIASIRTQTFGECGVGTLRWASPETLAQKPIANEKSDVFSLGVVFWELATRKLPFHEISNELQVLLIVKYEKARPDIPEDCPALFSAIIEKCWQHFPEDRPSSQEVVDYFAAHSEEFRNSLNV